MTQRVDKDSLQLDKPRRTPGHPTKSHIVKTKVDGKERIIRFGEQGASTAGKPKEGESDRMKQKRASFKARHAKNIAKGKSSPAYWANRVKWATGGPVELQQMAVKYEEGGDVNVRKLVNSMRKMFSLDTPKDMTTGETVADIAAGFVPGLGTAQAARDFERARREGDKLGMGLASVGMIPVVGGVVKGGKAAAKSLAEMAEQYGAKVPEFITAYRGAAAGNAQRSSMNPGVVFMSRNPETAKQYGDVVEHKLRGDLKLLDMNPNNPEARRVLFRTGDYETLKDLGIKSEKDLKNPDKFAELFTEGASDYALGMLPGKHAPAVLQAYGYQGAKWGDDFWLAGKAEDYLAKPPVKEQKMLQGVYRGYAGEPGASAELFATPQKRVADYYAQKRAAQTGEAPHAEMLLVDPFAGKQYGHATAGTGKNPPMVTKARKLKPEDVKERTQLYAEGGYVEYDPAAVDNIVNQIREGIYG
jgi:hypothetical protein